MAHHNRDRRYKSFDNCIGSLFDNRNSGCSPPKWVCRKSCTVCMLDKKVVRSCNDSKLQTLPRRGGFGCKRHSAWEKGGFSKSIRDFSLTQKNIPFLQNSSFAYGQQTDYTRTVPVWQHRNVENFGLEIIGK